MFRFIQQLVIVIGLIIVLAALPTVIQVNPIDHTVDFKLSSITEVFKKFTEEISKGGLGTYEIGGQKRQIADDIRNLFITSLKIMLVGVSSALIISIFFGMFVSRFQLSKIFNLILNILAIIPDFIIIIFSMIIAIKVYKYTGVRVISLRPDGGALNIWFPMILVSIAPTLYLFKIISIKYYQTSGEDYIRTAVAKGMRTNYINFNHVYKNIEPFIKAELTKIISLAVGNLFIIEYLLNVSGITKFIFLAKGPHPIVIGLLGILIISLLVYLFIRLLLYVFKRGFIYE